MAKFGESNDLIKCSFCAKGQKQVKKLIAGPSVYICDECIDLCNDIIADEFGDRPEFVLEDLPTPREISAFLDEFVIGQVDAKKILRSPSTTTTSVETLLFEFFGLPPSRFSVDPYIFYGKHSIDKKAFQPQQMQRWTKLIKNPLLFAALRQMCLQGHLIDFAYKLSERGSKYGVNWYGITFTSDKPKIEWDKTEEERDEFQKDSNREESLKLPEAASDQPEKVFERQLADLMERMKEYGTEGEWKPEKVSYTLRKEEWTNLLFLLRQDAPQIEAIGFIKEFPHLLSNSDIRNFLEIILFDVGNTSMAETFKRNPIFVKALPSVLEEEIKKHLALARKEKEHYNHALFLLSITRRFEGIYWSFRNEIGEFSSFFQQFPFDQILNNRSLADFHYRALFEQMMISLEQIISFGKTDLFGAIDAAHTIRQFHRLKALPCQPHDVDPNEMDKLTRLYETLLEQSTLNERVERLAPLLDTLCDDRGLKLDHSTWQAPSLSFIMINIKWI